MNSHTRLEFESEANVEGMLDGVAPPWQARLFRWVEAGTVLFVALTLLAMFFYQGGTALDPARPGYSFFENFFSELGLTVAHSGRTNTVSALLFFIALASAGVCLILFFIAAPLLFRESRWSYLLSLLGSAFGVLSGIGFTGIAFTPANLFIDAHIFFVLWAFRLFPLAVIPYVPAILGQPRYPNRYAFLFMGFAALLLLYVGLLIQGPSPSTAGGRIVQVTGQKVIAYASLLTIYLQARGAGSVLEARRLSVPT